MNRLIPLPVLIVAAWLLAGCIGTSAEHNNTGNDLYLQGDTNGAWAAYQLAVVTAPDQPESYVNAAPALARIGQYERAIAALNLALRTADDELAARIYYTLGNIYFELSRYKEAASAYQQTLLRHPDDQDARHNLELAQRRIVVPSPTPADPQDTQPTAGQTTTAPAPNPAGAVSTGAPTATAPGATPSPDGGNTSPTPQPGPTISRDEAERRLDAIQNGQQTLNQFFLTLTPPAPQSDEDW